MILYHGSTVEIKDPRIIKSEIGRDFGFAFYTTDIQEQAERWAIRRAKIQNRTAKEKVFPIVNIYEWEPSDEFLTKEFVYPYGEKLFKEEKPMTLSQAAMETLAIVAYKQPVTRLEIEEIRGVSCEVMLKKLVAMDLIEAADRLDTVGKPLLYRVTDTFLDTFQLETLEELPALPDREISDNLFEEE